MASHLTASARLMAARLPLVFGIAVALNYPWELAQTPLYAELPPFVSRLWHCFVASLGDGVLVLVIAGFGSLVYRDPAWFLRRGVPRDMMAAGGGFVIAVIVEWIAVYGMRRWSYGPTMPIVHPLEVGLTPLLQMTVLTPVIFRATDAAVKALRLGVR